MTFCFRNQCINLHYFSVLNGNQDHGKIMKLSMIYMNLRCNDAADAFLKKYTRETSMWEDILGIQFGLLGSGALCHEFNVD